MVSLTCKFYRFSIVIIMLSLLSVNLFATNYYVDATNGNDDNQGLSPDHAFKTISIVNSMKFNPGDRILFKRGEMWREQLIVPSSGVTDNPIVFEAYGSGNRPIINGANLITGEWSQHEGLIWKVAVSTTPKIVITADTIAT